MPSKGLGISWVGCVVYSLKNVLVKRLSDLLVNVVTDESQCQ